VFWLIHYPSTTVIFGPVVSDDPALSLQALIEPSAGEWRQDVERGILYTGCLKEFQGFIENRFAIVIEAEDDSCLHCNAVRMNPPDGLGILVNSIESFGDLVDTSLGN